MGWNINDEQMGCLEVVNLMHLVMYSSHLLLVLFRVVSHGVHAGEILLLPHQVSDSGRHLL